MTGTTDEGDEYFRSADTNATGTAIFAVPPGMYDVEIVEVPDGYAIDPADRDRRGRRRRRGRDGQPGQHGPDEADATKIIDTAVPGLLVCVYEQSYDQGGKPMPIEESRTAATAAGAAAEGLRAWAG